MSDALAHAERQVIGAALLRPDSYDLTDLRAEHFRDLKARLAWDAIGAARTAGESYDETTLAATMPEAQQGDMIVWMSSCHDGCPTADTIEHYAEIIRDAFVGRRVRAAVADAQDAVERGGLGGVESLDAYVAALSAIDAESGGDKSLTIRQLVHDRMKQFEAMQKARDNGDTTVNGIPTDIAVLDAILGGVHPGIITIVAARPGHGKSSLGLALTDNATSKGIGVHVFSLEDTRESYCDRVIARKSRVAADKMRTGALNQGDMRGISGAVGDLYQRKTWIVDDRSGLTAEEIVRAVRSKKRENKTQLVIVDYLQIVAHDHRMQRHEAIGRSVDMLADAAKQDGIAYVVMSQLNRDLEKRPDKRPMLSDMAECGKIEQRAKCVIGMFRPWVYDNAQRDDKIELHILKNSNGRTGHVTASWDGPTTTIR